MSNEMIEHRARKRQEEMKRKDAEIHRKNLISLEEAVDKVLKTRADEFYPLLEDDKKFVEKVTSIYGSLPAGLFSTACDMIKDKLKNAPSQEEMEVSAKALMERGEWVIAEIAKRERGEPYDEELLKAADAEIAKMEAGEQNPYPEGATIFGES